MLIKRADAVVLLLFIQTKAVETYFHVVLFIMLYSINIAWRSAI